MIKSPEQIDGLVAWIESDESGDIINKLDSKRGSVFVWTDPNNPSRGCQLVYGRQLTSEEENLVNQWLVEKYNPPMDQLPKS